MIELRGIEISYTTSGKNIKLITRSERGDDYETFEYPKSKKLNEKAILKFLAEQLNLPGGKVSIAPHVKIPLEK